MELPGARRAWIDASKMRDYLLSPSHPVGRFKASFFVSLGYSQADWQRLRRDLMQHGASGSAMHGPSSPHGRKYEVRGTLVGPAGREAALVSVWIILHGEDVPRFVTAFPG